MIKDTMFANAKMPLSFSQMMHHTKTSVTFSRTVFESGHHDKCNWYKIVCRKSHPTWSRFDARYDRQTSENDAYLHGRSPHPKTKSFFLNVSTYITSETVYKIFRWIVLKIKGSHIEWPTGSAYQKETLSQQRSKGLLPNISSHFDESCTHTSCQQTHRQQTIVDGWR